MLSPEFLAAFRRERLLQAFAEATAERGYRDVTVAHVVAAADMSRNSFYEHFDNKEDGFLALLQGGFDDLFARVQEGCPGAESDFAARVQAGLDAAFEWIAAEPALSRCCLLEAPMAGPEAFDLQHKCRDRLASLLTAAAPRDEARPELTGPMVIGGMLFLLKIELQREGPAAISALGSQMLLYARLVFDA